MTSYYSNIPLLRSNFPGVRPFALFVLGYILGDSFGRMELRRSFLRPAWLKVSKVARWVFRWSWMLALGYLVWLCILGVLWLGYFAGCVM